VGPGGGERPEGQAARLVADSRRALFPGRAMDETSALLRLVNAQLDLVLVRQAAHIERGDAMSAEIDRIKQSVEKLTTVNQSAITLMTTLSAEIRGRLDDRAALTALADEIDRRAVELGTAVTANTPAQGGGGGGTSPAPPPAAGVREVG
jgi:hypothetical protein